MNHSRTSSLENPMTIKAFKDSPVTIRSKTATPTFPNNHIFDPRGSDSSCLAANKGARPVCHPANTSPDIVEVYENNVEISRYPFPSLPGFGTSESRRRDMPQSTNSSSLPAPLSLSQHRGCCCNHTHHHHHTIVINGHQIDAVSKELFEKTVAENLSRDSLIRPSVLKTTSCPVWADGSRRAGHLMNKRPNTEAEIDPTAPHPAHINTSVPFGNQNSSNGNYGELGRRNDLQNRPNCRHQNPVNDAGEKCCGKPSVGVLVLLTVLILVTLSLLSGLIYFLVRGNVSATDSSSETSVPSVSTVLNQNAICGKFPEKYLSLSTRTVNPKYPVSSSPSTKDEHRVNSSLTKRIIGGVPASIVHYPSQIARSAYNPETPENDIDRTMVRPRIFGGSDTAANRFPWQVGLWVKHQGIKCGGSLIMSNWVITAAHCTASNGKPSAWTAYMGMSILKQKSQPPAQSSKVVAIIQHEQYNNHTYDYDVSLMKLLTPVTFSPSVKPICLPESTTVYKGGTECYISGWGSTTNTGLETASPTLQYAQINIIALEECNKWMEEKISDRMICAGEDAGGKDACQGDSGGPLACYDDEKKSWTLAGSVSWGYKCGQPKEPGVYAKMSFFVVWIWNKIGRHEGWIEEFDDDAGMGSGTW